MNTLICFGDSLVSGYGLRKGEGWCEVLQRNDFIHGEWKIINKGIPGDTTTGLLSRSYKDVISKCPNAVAILIGTNDVLLGRTIDFIYENIIFLVNELLSNKIKPIIISPPGIIETMAIKSWDPGYIYTNVNGAISELIEKLSIYSKAHDFSFINLYAILKAAVKLKNLLSSEEFYIDGIHLNKKGNIILANEVMKILMNK